MDAITELAFDLGAKRLIVVQSDVEVHVRCAPGAENGGQCALCSS